jgi:hypothetical protein
MLWSEFPCPSCSASVPSIGRQDRKYVLRLLIKTGLGDNSLYTGLCAGMVARGHVARCLGEKEDSRCDPRCGRGSPLCFLLRCLGRLLRRIRSRTCLCPQAWLELALLRRSLLLLHGPSESRFLRVRPAALTPREGGELGVGAPRHVQQTGNKGCLRRVWYLAIASGPFIRLSREPCVLAHCCPRCLTSSKGFIGLWPSATERLPR